jgi:hypothetical protein
MIDKTEARETCAVSSAIRMLLDEQALTKSPR